MRRSVEWASNCSPFVRLIVVVVLLLGIGKYAQAIVVPNETNADAGSLPGQVQIGNDGTASYSIPIVVPPGTAGLVPTLSLSYSSIGRDGLLGRGWSISGLSAITRCKRTLKHDTYVGRVGLDANDRYCMGGQRLMLVSGVYGATAEYRTEIDINAKITSIGNNTAKGPDSWEVRTKDGRILRFGTTVDSSIEAQGKSPTVISTWLVARVEDRSGNYMTFAYDKSANATEGAFYPTQISYTGNTNAPATLPYNAVRFVYDTSRPDPIISYTAGSKSSILRRLTAVRTYVNIDAAGNGGTLVRDHRITYTQNAHSGRSLVDNIQVFDGAASPTNWPKTQFSYQQRTAAHNAFATSGPVGGLIINYAGLTPTFARTLAAIVIGDFNGDGKTDIAQGNNSGVWNVCLSSGTALSCSNWSGPPRTASKVVPGDYNGDGRLDLAYNDGSIPSVRVCLSTGSSFNCQNWTGGWASKMSSGDFDGDGRTDLILGGPSSTLCKSTGTGFSCAAYTNVNSALAMAVADEYIASSVVTGDFSGDGRTDVAAYTSDISESLPTPWNVCVAGDAGFTCTAWTGNIGRTDNLQLPAPYPSGRTAVGPLNQDAQDDFVTVFSITPLGATASAHQCRSTGNAFVCNSNIASADYPSHIADIDGDGRADSLAVGSSSNRVCQVGASSLTCANWTTTVPGGYPTTGLMTFYGDVNGDGRADKIIYHQPTGKWYFSIAQGPTPDVMTTVVNGIGHRSEISYKPLADATVYTKDTNAVYPQRDVTGSAMVVSQLRTSDGIGGLSSINYRYGGKKSDLIGVGDLGFRWREATDAISQVTQRTEFRQDHPFVGMTSLAISKHGPTACELLRTTHTLTDVASQVGGKVHFPYATISVVTNKELNGCGLVSTVTTDSVTYDAAYGHLTNKKTTAQAGAETFTSTASNTYSAPGTAWLLDLVNTASEVRSAPLAPGQATNSVTRTTSFTYVPNTRLIASETIEPGNTALKVVADTAARDRFGNVTNRFVQWTPPGSSTLSTRTIETVSAMDARGRWPLTVQNALGHSSSQVRDDAYGNTTSATDANNLTTTWLFDTFGRQRRQTDPDGSYATTSIKQCTSSCGQAKVVTIAKEYSFLGVEIAVPKAIYADVLGREVLAQTWGFSGTEIRAESEYNAQRRLQRAARPHFVADAAVWTTYTAYDDLSRNTSLSTPEGVFTTAYSGLATTLTNPKNQVRTELRNGLNLLKTFTDAANYVINYWYDPFGNLLRTQDPKGNAIRVTYDTRGRRTSLIDPDLGTINYTVDALGQVVQQSDAASQITSFVFDDLGRMKQRLEADLNSNWDYDTAANGKGKMAEAYTLAGGGVKDYRRIHTYDSLSRPSSTTIRLDKDYVWTAGYESGTGRLMTEAREVRDIGAGTGPGHTFTHGYNVNGFLDKVSEGATVLWQVQNVNAAGQLRQGIYANGVANERTYWDSTSGRVKTIIATGPGGAASVQNDFYTYDAVGNLDQRKHIGNASGAQLTENFGYDSLNRLTSSQVVGQSAKSYLLDEIGNVSSKTGVGTYTYPASGAASVRPHAVSSINGSVNGIVNPSFNYDSNGNLLAGAGRSYTWTSFDLPQSITLGAGATMATDAFLHGPEHQRTRQLRSVGSPAVAQSTVYYGGAIERELITATATTITRTYMPLGLGMVQDTQVGAGATTTARRYAHKDHLGSVLALSDDAGSVVERQAYDGWGRRRNLDGNDDVSVQPNQLAGGVDNKGYTGHEHLDNVALVHMNGRVYDPIVSRFTSADPFVEESQPGQGANRYAYVLNNPTGNTDPTGLVTETQTSGATNEQSVSSKAGGWAVYYARPKDGGGDPVSQQQQSDRNEAPSERRPNGQQTWSGASAGASSSTAVPPSTEAEERTPGQILSEKVHAVGNDIAKSLSTLMQTAYEVLAGGGVKAGVAVTSAAAGGVKVFVVKEAAKDAAKAAKGAMWTSTKSQSIAENAFRHFKDHGGDFGAKNAVDYVRKAQDFLHNPGAGVLSKTRGNGDVVRFDPATNAFGVMDKTGAPRTFFVPDPAKHGYRTNLDYFHAQ